MSQLKKFSPGDVIVSAEHLSKQYRGCLALNDVTLHIKKGQLIGLVGKNGAGKTTLIRLLTGVAWPTTGHISVFGSVNQKEMETNLSRVAAMIEQPALYENMTATENLMTACILNDVKNPMDGYIRDKFEFVGLPESYLDKRPVKNYSLGMRQRVGIAMAMIGDPELMILDEPTNGLDPEGIRQIRELLLKLNKEKGVTIIVSSHILSELSKFASSYIFIDRGRFVEEISAEDLESKAGKVLIVKTDNNAKAQEVLLAAHFDAEIVKDSVYVHNIKEPAEVLNVISKNSLALLGFKEEENSLEDYFVDVVGGK